MRTYDIVVADAMNNELSFSGVEYSDYDRLLDMALREGYTVTIASSRESE